MATTYIERMQRREGQYDQYTVKEGDISRQDEEDDHSRNIPPPYLLHLQAESDRIFIEHESCGAPADR